tara:strand:- start:271 stop:1449 length:1179 start_codon:yes stop_codon:yes gene_type:complete
MEKQFLKSKKLRVLINGIHAKSGGGVTYLQNILSLLADDPELELHLFLHRDQFTLFGLIDERIHMHLMDYPNGFFSALYWEQASLPILARAMSADVTLSPANYGPLFAPAQVIVLRNSLAVAGRETRLIKRLYWAGLTLMTALSLSRCRRAIAVSQYARSALTFGLGSRLIGKVAVVHHGVRDIFRPSTPSRAENFLLAVSDIYVQKNLHTLIAALPEIKRRNPDISLKIAGRAIDKGYLAEIQTVIDENNLHDSVEFLGAQTTDQLVELYQRCKLFVFPSTVETFGNPLVEAMASGAAIASSNTAAMPEIVGDAALFFDPLNVQQLAEKVSDLLNDDGLRETMRQKAIQRAGDFSWQLTARKTARVLKEAASRDRRKTIGISLDADAEGLR